MSSASWRTDRKDLHAQLAGREFHQMLMRLQHDEPALVRFRCWRDVLRFMRGQDGTQADKEAILRIIFRAHRRDRDHRWTTPLFAIFWPGLASLHLRTRRWDEDVARGAHGKGEKRGEGHKRDDRAEERWCRVTWAFLQALGELSPDECRCGIAPTVMWRTRDLLRNDYRRTWRGQVRETPTEPERLEDMERPEEAFEDSTFEAEEEAEVRKIREFWRAGVISEQAYLVIVGTRIYGQPLAEYARTRGLEEATERQRRHRAERKIEEFCRKVSRSPQSDGPFLIEPRGLDERRATG